VIALSLTQAIREGVLQRINHAIQSSERSICVAIQRGNTILDAVAAMLLRSVTAAE
jgi:hypothetical protein